MSSSSCKECGHPTEWAQDIGSAVCTQCGTLADPSQQSALTSADFINNTYPHNLPSSSTCARPILKSIRRNTTWDLPGQGADSRNERKKSTTHEFIRTLADRLGHHGAAIRAQAIFDSAVQRTSMRWGKATKLAAGAALVFAMREQGRGDRTHHVAYLLSEPIIALKRTQLHLLPHLDLTLPHTHPCVHLPTLATHLISLASASPASLPKDILAFLRPLVLSPTVLQDVLRTARALYDLPTLGSYASNGSSAGATACALLLLALEARASPPRSAPHALVLAAQLGAALGTREAMVMARYRMLVDTIEAGAARVPWLADARATRSKRISRRSWVAKAVLDVLQFRNELERAEIADRGGPIGLDIEGEADGGVIEGGDQGEDEAALDTLIAKVELNMADSTGAGVPEVTHAAGPMRKHKKSRTATGQATCFLLDPLARLAPAHPTLTHTAYLLSSDAATESAGLPTRLQLLAVERGSAEAINDDELFSDGELEGIVIGTDEQTVEECGRRAQALRVIWGEDDTEATRVGSGVETSEKHGRKCGKGRINMDKLAALLDSDDPFATLGVEDAKLAEGEETGDEDTELIAEDAWRSSGDWQVFEKSDSSS